MKQSATIKQLPDFCVRRVRRTPVCIGGLLLLFANVTLPAAFADDGAVTFSVVEREDRLLIALGGQAVAEYVFSDPRVWRPFFAQVKTASGKQVTRNYPPLQGTDATDHDTMHPGIWLAFGDISGIDFWRNKGRIEHLRWIGKPQVQNGQLTFSSESRLTRPDGSELARLDSRFQLTQHPGAWLLVWESTCYPKSADFALGDQEEMGFGVRMATPLIETNGGMITSSTGKTGAASTWGQAADWCDNSGTIDGQPVGVTLLTDRQNFRKSWWHNRNYGLLVANPFGRGALKQGEASRVSVKPTDHLTLRFAACIHEGLDYTPATAHRWFQEP